MGWLADVELERLDACRLALLLAMSRNVLSRSVTLGRHPHLDQAHRGTTIYEQFADAVRLVTGSVATDKSADRCCRSMESDSTPLRWNRIPIKAN